MTSNNVNSNHNLTTTLILNTRNVGVNAHFYTAIRTPVRSSVGRTLIGTARHSAHLVFEALGGATHILGGTVSSRIITVRHHRNNIRFTRVHPLITNTHNRTTLGSNRISGNIVATNRIINLVSSVPAYTRLVRHVITSYRRHLSVTSD